MSPEAAGALRRPSARADRPDPLRSSMEITLPSRRRSDMVDALARRCDEVVILCDRVGRHRCAPNVRLLTFRSGSRAGRAGLRAVWPPRAPASGQASGCRARPRSASVPSHTRRAPVQALPDPTRPLVHAPADGSAHSGSRRVSPMSCSASTGAPSRWSREGSRHRPRDRRGEGTAPARLAGGGTAAASFGLGRMTPWKGSQRSSRGLRARARAGPRRRAASCGGPA